MSKKNVERIDPSKVEAIKDKLQSGFYTLEEKLEQGKGEEILEIVQGALESQVSENLERNLIENLNTYLASKNLISIILSVLTNNNPHVHEEVGIEIPPNSKKFLEKLARKFGFRVKQSVKKYYSPNDWRYLNSESRQGEQFQGPRLHTNILKWNDDRVVITSGLPDVIKFADHLIRNLNSKFEKFDNVNGEVMLQRLKKMQEDTRKLEKKLSRASKQKE